MAKRVGIVGAGVTPFKGTWREKTYYELAQMATREAVRVLIDDQGIGLRDAGALLGLSYERVRQLHASEAPGVAPRPGGTAVPIMSTDEL